ncbi:unnamed protein product [Symbiodinium sp. CCMP2592]|nr:unnamed protein product [Symbiodinium sp. CCMP2592]
MSMLSLAVDAVEDLFGWHGKVAGSDVLEGYLDPLREALSLDTRLLRNLKRRSALQDLHTALHASDRALLVNRATVTAADSSKCEDVALQCMLDRAAKPFVELWDDVADFFQAWYRCHDPSSDSTGVTGEESEPDELTFTSQASSPSSGMSSIPCTDYSTSADEMVDEGQLMPLRRAGLHAELGASCLLGLSRLDGGSGLEHVPETELDESSEITLVACRIHASHFGLTVLNVLGAMECSVLAGRLLFIDGLGSIDGSGGGSALASSIWPLARFLQCQAVLLKARAGSEGFWARAGFTGLLSAWRTKRRANQAGSPQRRALTSLHEEMAPIPVGLADRDLEHLVSNVLQVANAGAMIFFSWVS